MAGMIEPNRLLLLLFALAMALAGCAAPTPEAALPLAADRPTFLFFFTDG